MNAHGTESVHKQAKIYKIVGGVLFAATAATVAAAEWHHLGITLGIFVAVLIAVFKGSLVARYFMHLSAERKLIYWVLALTAFFFVAMIALILWTHGDQQGQPHGIFTTPPRAAQPAATRN
ncbi:MAG TPA: cytochrome C oxidase subunit IV family protein [Verrucomicrobiae bacterium]|nr:cytochrome C oxidase subunit IV family protein [Verrucomicrobiae bacterium]